jgi:hypothetical protein
MSMSCAYARELFSRLFEIIEYLPAANGVHQDYSVTVREIGPLFVTHASATLAMMHMVIKDLRFAY